MSKSKTNPSRDAAGEWIYWGASGVLQPLSEAFLYRAPASDPRQSGSCCRLDRRAGRRPRS